MWIKLAVSVFLLICITLASLSKVRVADIGVDAWLGCETASEITIDGNVYYACQNEVTPELLNRLSLVSAVKNFSRDRLGFERTENYIFYNPSPQMIYRLYVTGEFQIPQKARGWIYLHQDSQYREEISSPIILQSWFDNLKDEEAYYREKGYDTYRREYSNYGGGCYLSDTFLSSSIPYQVATIIHEDWHDNIEQDFNNEESTATLIGRIGAIFFIGEHFGTTSEEYSRAKERLQEWVNYSREIVDCNKMLLDLYRSDLSENEMRETKKTLLEGTSYNNALIWGTLPYTVKFNELYPLYNGNLEEFLEILKGIE